MSTKRNSESSRTKHGELARREYGLPAPEGPAVNPAAAGPQGSGDDPKDTTGTGYTGGMETGTGDRNRQREPPPYLSLSRSSWARSACCLSVGAPPSPVSWLPNGGSHHQIRVSSSIPWLPVGGSCC